MLSALICVAAQVMLLHAKASTGTARQEERKELVSLVSPALHAAMQEEARELVEGYRTTGYRVYTYRIDFIDMALIARGLWPREALEPWLAPQTAATPHTITVGGAAAGAAAADGGAPDSMGLGCGPLSDVVVVNLSGSWEASYEDNNDKLLVRSAESFVPPCVSYARGKQRRYVGAGGTHALDSQPGDWVFYRGPLPCEAPAEAELPPWRVLKWG